MSFEGYTRTLCKNGHLYECGVYEVCYGYYGEPISEWKCPFCGEEKDWEQLVDQTNDEGFAVELKVKEPAEMKTCEHCGHTEQIKPPTYYPPTPEEWDEQLKVWEMAHGYYCCGDE